MTMVLDAQGNRDDRLDPIDESFLVSFFGMVATEFADATEAGDTVRADLLKEHCR